MRAVSLTIMTGGGVPILDTVSKVESCFPEYLPEYAVLRHPVSDCVVVHWRKIAVSDSRDMNGAVAAIEESMRGSRIIFEEWGGDPGFLRKYLTIVLGGALLAGSFLYNLATR